MCLLMKEKTLCPRLMLTFLLATGLPFAVHGSDMQQAYLSACEKIKTCARQEMDTQLLGPQMMQMIEASFEQMCLMLPQSGQDAEEELDEDLARHARNCMASIGRLSCAALDEDGTSTPECQAYERKVEAYEQ